MRFITTLLFAISLIISANTFGKIKYKQYFTEEALRVDFRITSDKSGEEVFLERLVQEIEWGGRRANLQTFHNLGTYKFEVRDTKSKQLIYTDGFCTLSEEYMATDEASNQAKSFYNALQIPFPKELADLTITKWQFGDYIDTLLKVTINPNGLNIEKNRKFAFEKKYTHYSDKPENCIDIVILAEGYTKEEEGQFFKDAELLTHQMLSAKVFNKNQMHLNFAAIASISEDSGVDDPGIKVKKNTIFDGSYYTFGSERYLMMKDYSKVREVAGLLPYDQIYILVNSEKYGGGGIFNYGSVATAKSRNAKEVVIHEFGHAFGGLGDEYYNSETAYDNLFDKNTEPWQPNLTTNLRFASKWKAMVHKGIPIPTPNEAHFGTQTVGLFEGGGYQAKGIYRPAFDCRMKTNEADDFCPVCYKSIFEMILFYTGK